MSKLSKYQKKYAKDLKAGLRRTMYKADGTTMRKDPATGKFVIMEGKLWTIERCCEKWGITKKTYYNWVDEFTSFAEAHEIGERDYKLSQQEIFERALFDKKMNGGLVKLLAESELGMSSKQEVKKTVETTHINKIQIEVLQQPAPQLEQQPNNVIDITNIIEQHDKEKVGTEER